MRETRLQSGISIHHVKLKRFWMACLFATVIGLLPAGCATTKAPISARSIHQLKVREFHAGPEEHLIVSGIYFNGKLAVGTITTSLKDRCLLIEAFSTRPSRKSSGKINLKIPISYQFDSVAFGTPQDVIWRHPMSRVDGKPRKEGLQ